MDMYKMEKTTAFVHHKLEKFTSCWENWLKYVILLVLKMNTSKIVFSKQCLFLNVNKNI